ncbi:ABC transporter ATP-binding protein [Advenella sp. RU8]|jgi:peptide/nickel transport system ATP-binding protein|uniref:ABC transporter ATP-binding protein n=1 Tax=unclassified Advenella TaxID=2685285 RepID=UPI00145F0979|nr:ABC transporter ATP-binding protein [Advenella sp. EE-W14]NLN67931.1 ABC transporter ATP-binding protein [Alcaligenaceae bacterium]
MPLPISSPENRRDVDVDAGQQPEIQLKPATGLRSVQGAAAPANQEATLSIRNLKVAFEQQDRIVQVLHGIDLDILPGETVGIVGESGCGKSVTWLAIMGLLGKRARLSGSVKLNRQEILSASSTVLTGLRGKRIAMIFQDPSSSLNPAHRIGSQVAEAVSLHRGLHGQAALEEAKRLLDRVRIPDAAQRMKAYPHELSGGMNQRVMIAMALAGEPELLIADEPTTALDATVQAQILDLLKEVRAESGMAMALISHDLGVIADISDRVMVMYAGRVVESASSERIFSSPAHPYTRGLMDALPDLQSSGRLKSIPGFVPEPGKLPLGCSFSPRCERSTQLCVNAQPVQVRLDREHLVSCFNLGEQSSVA